MSKSIVTRKRLVFALMAAVFAAAVAVLVALHPWQGEGFGDAQMGQADDAASPATEGTSSGEAPDAALSDGWVLQMWDDLAVMTGRGKYEAWTAVEGDAPWDFEVTEASTGQSRRYAISDEHRAQAAKAGQGDDVWGFIDYENEVTSEYGVTLFAEADEAAASFDVLDSTGVSRRYEASTPLRAYAEAAKVYVASKGEEGEWKPPTVKRNKWGYTADEMEYVTITPDDEAIEKDVVVVVFEGSVSDERIRQIASEVGGEPFDGVHEGELMLSYLDQDGVEIRDRSGAVEIMAWLKLDGSIAEWDAADALEAYPEVTRTFYSHVGTWSINSLPADSGDASSTEPSVDEEEANIVRESIPAYLQYYLRYSGFKDAWETVHCDRAVSIGVVDTGVDWKNEELLPNIDTGRMASAADMYDEGDVLSVGEDCDMGDWHVIRDDDGNVTSNNRHGTHVVSVVSALAGDDAGCDGASYNALVIPAKYTRSDGSGTSATVVACFRYLLSLEEPPSVINFSNTVGYETLEEAKNSSYGRDMQQLVDEAWDKGIVVVASAGNDGEPQGLGGDGVAQEHIDYNQYNVPACLDRVVSVGALREPGWGVSPEEEVPEVCSWSNTASDVDICAYGESIYTVNPYASLLEVPLWYTTVQGTSFAAPQVAAAAALVKKAHPGYDAQNVVDALLLTAGKSPYMDGADYTAAYGYGCLDADAAVMWSSQLKPGSGSGGSSGDWSPTAGGSFAEKFAEKQGDAA